jgi:hypothetical protein
MIRIPKIELSREEDLSTRAVITLLLLTIICVRAHEYSHIVAVLIDGGTFKSSFGHVQHFDDNRAATCIAGPLVNYTWMWIGLGLLLFSKKRKKSGFTLIFASLPVARLFDNIFPFVLGRDEHCAAYTLQVPVFVFAGIAWIIVLVPLVFAYLSIDSNSRVLWFISFFLVLPVLCAIVVSGLGDFFLLGIIHSRPFAQTVLAAGFHGIPIIVLFLDLVFIISFLYINHLNIHTKDS